MKFLLGLPSIDGKYDVMVLSSIINQLEFINSDKHEIQCHVLKNTMIYNARNQIAEAAKDYDYLFFIDSDCVLPNGTLQRLFNHKKDIVAGMYFQKSGLHCPVIYTRNEKGTFDVILDYPENQLIEVDGIGMGCCLIKTSVFKDIKDPFAPYQIENGAFIGAEDLSFCIRAKEKGYKVYVDTGIQALHQTSVYISETFHKRAVEEYNKKIKERDLNGE